MPYVLETYCKNKCFYLSITLYRVCINTLYTTSYGEFYVCNTESVWTTIYRYPCRQQWNTKRSTCVWLSLYVTFSCIICPNSFLFSFLLRMRLRKRNTGNMLLVYLTPTRKHIHNQHHKNHLCLSIYIPKLCPNHLSHSLSHSLSLSLSLLFLFLSSWQYAKRQICCIYHENISYFLKRLK